MASTYHYQREHSNAISLFTEKALLSLLLPQESIVNYYDQSWSAFKRATSHQI